MDAAANQRIEMHCHLILSGMGEHTALLGIPDTLAVALVNHVEFTTVLARQALCCIAV